MKALQENRRIEFSKKRFTQRPQPVLQTQRLRCLQVRFPMAGSPQRQPSSPSLFFQRDTGTAFQRTSQKLCCCPASSQPSPAGTESAACPRGTPHHSKKSHWQSYGSYRSLCSTGHCHGALPTLGHTSCKGNTNQSKAEPPLFHHWHWGPLCLKLLIQLQVSPWSLHKESPGALHGPQMPAGEAHLVLVRMSQ